MSSSLWIQHVPAGKFITVTPTTRLLVVNACLGLTLPPGTKGRGALFFGVVGCSELRSVASLARDTCEQTCLDLTLEAHVQYAFHAEGSFTFDLLGHYPSAVDAAIKKSASPAKKSSKKSENAKSKKARASSSSKSKSKATHAQPVSSNETAHANEFGF